MTLSIRTQPRSERPARWTNRPHRAKKRAYMVFAGNGQRPPSSLLEQPLEICPAAFMSASMLTRQRRHKLLPAKGMTHVGGAALIVLYLVFVILQVLWL
jgi:hypothetical protein